MTVLPIQLDLQAPGPLYRQLANRLRGAAMDGLIAPGARLPSTRALAAQLAVARGTVEAAYAVLAGEGAIEARGGSGGTIIATSLRAGQGPARQTVMPFAQPGVSAPPPALLPFRLGLPALDQFPRKLWSNLIARAARRVGEPELAYPDPAGLPRFRQSIAGYLRLARGVAAEPDDIVVTAGFQGALALIRQVLLRPGEPAIIEDPCYPYTRQALEASGARIVPVRVDRDGIRIAAAPRARLAIVTPAHQSPLGVTLSLPRRIELIDWATTNDAWIVEDDYDAEYRYTGRPLPALKSLDRADRVIHCGSFSKVMFPGLRLGYLVAPRELREALRRAAQLASHGLPITQQDALSTFMDQGHFPRHVRRMRMLYAARRQALASALEQAFGQRAGIDLAAGGMHLLLRLDGDDTVHARAAAAARLAPTALSSLAIAHDAGQGLLLGFTNIAEADAPALAARLAQAIRG